MTDLELESFMAITPEESELFRTKDPERWEQMRAICDKMQDVVLWDQGVGPLPPGVIVCGPRQIKGGRP